MIGAYTRVPAFAYPGWRLTVPGGPAGGHYKGFTHTQSAGTDIPPNDAYEQDREDGMSSHDPVHASPRNPRGVYRSSAEVPPRPNASGRAMTYSGFQTQRHAGTSVSPGSFPADFLESDEDAFLSGLSGLSGDDPQLGAYFTAIDSVDGGSQLVRAVAPDAESGVYPNPVFSVTLDRPNTVLPSPARSWIPPGTVPPAASGATSVVRQLPPTPMPAPPSPSVSVVTAPPVSPAPAPIVATHQVVPLRDGSGNFLNLSTGDVIPPSGVSQNPATGELTASSVAGRALSWFEQHSLFASLPNWVVLGGGLMLASAFLGGRRR